MEIHSARLPKPRRMGLVGCFLSFLLRVAASQGLVAAEQACISRPFNIIETVLPRGMSPAEVEDRVKQVCAAYGGLCRSQEEVVVRDSFARRLDELHAQEVHYAGAPIRLVLDRTIDVEMSYGSHNSTILKLSPGVDATVTAALVCKRLGLDHRHDKDCAVLRDLVFDKMRQVGDVCGHDFDLRARAATATPISPVLCPHIVQSVLAYLSDPASGYPTGLPPPSEADLHWLAKSPPNGTTLESTQDVPITIVLRAGDVEIPLSKVEAIAGVNITVLAMLDFDFWRILTSRQAADAYLLGFLGRHVCLYQLMSDKDYPLSQLVLTSFRWGRVLDDLQATAQTRAYYSLYPQTLFLRAQVLERMQRHEEAVNSFTVGLGCMGWEAVPPPPPLLHPLPPGPRRPSERYISFHMVQGGLNNQVVELAGMVAIANALDRVLVPPTLWSGDFIGNAHVLEFQRLFDLRATRTNLAGYVRMWSEEEWEEPLPPAASMEIPEWSKAKLDLDFHRHHLGGPQAAGIPHIVLKGGYGQFHAHRGPRITKQVVRSLVFSKEVTQLADQLIALMLQQAQGGGYLAVHTRVEVDWRDYARNREMASDNMVTFWFGSEEIASRISRQPRLRHLRVVYVAVGAGMVEDPRPVLEERLMNTSDAGSEVRVFTKWDLIPDTEALPYALQSAVDLLVCERAAAFVGTSYSTFSNAVAVRMHDQGKASYIYNVRDSPMALERVDAGLMHEPYDATYRPTTTRQCGWRPEQGRAAASPSSSLLPPRQHLADGTKNSSGSCADTEAATALAAFVESHTDNTVW